MDNKKNIPNDIIERLKEFSSNMILLDFDYDENMLKYHADLQQDIEMIVNVPYNNELYLCVETSNPNYASDTKMIHKIKRFMGPLFASSSASCWRCSPFDGTGTLSYYFVDAEIQFRFLGADLVCNIAEYIGNLGYGV